MTVRLLVRRARNRARLAAKLVREAPQRRALAAAPHSDDIAVFYGWRKLPSLSEPSGGGMVKFQQLAERYPNTPVGFNVLYLGSSSTPPDAESLVRVARRRSAAFLWNQNGVAYPGWHGPGWKSTNRTPARLLRSADHVLYQSEFCKLAADVWYGETPDSWEILHNAVDTTRFVPLARQRRAFTLLLGGSQYQQYRVETALRTLQLLPDARLVVTGAISFDVSELVASLGVADRVELLGPYSQADAPSIVGDADILLHTKYNDPCPTVVIEAMACGLPVVYSASGGTPELVGDDAGVGVPAPLDWEHDHPPAPDALAEAVLRIRERLDEYSGAARERAVARFDLRPWVERHRELFEQLQPSRE